LSSLGDIQNKVSFEEAASIFSDPQGIDGPDALHSREEPRYLRIANSIDGRVLIVAYTAKQTKKKKTRPSKKIPLEGDDIDYSDIPETTDEELKGMRRVGRPTLVESPRRLIAIRIDPTTLDLLQRLAQDEGIGY